MVVPPLWMRSGLYHVISVHVTWLTLSGHQCARDLVEEFVCAKVLPLRANQSWFVVKDDEKYRARGLKGLGLNVKQA